MTLIVLISVPTTVIGGSVVSSIIAGKTPTEAIVILGENVDSLFGRIDIVEQNQSDLATTTSLLVASTTTLKQEQDSLKVQQIILTGAQSALEDTQSLLQKQQAAIDLQTQILLDSQARLAEEQAKAAARESTINTQITQATQDIAQIKTISTVRTMSISSLVTGTPKIVTQESSRILLFSVQLHNTGNTDVLVTGVTIGRFDSLQALYVKNSSGDVLGSNTTPTGEAPIQIAVTVSPGAKTTLAIEAVTSDQILADGLRFSQPYLTNLSSTATSVTGLPIRGPALEIE